MPVFRGIIGILSGAAILLAAGCSGPRMVRMDKDTYIDKCKGAWAGQMIGVCYGAPYEFHYQARIMEDPIKPWQPGRIRGAIGQDDCYVEMTWLASLEAHGLDITYEQAGKDFAKGTYGLAHANRYGRENVRAGIMPPASGHPSNNRHADDIDFQIESDLFGIICPALPRESNRLCDVFGHIMNYGDGVYGGMFVAGMYCAAFVENEDVEKVVRFGLACIPPGSQYYKCVADTIRWYHEEPDNWRATWQKLEDKWQDDIDCVPGSPFNIDAKINGAYIVVGLLYGQGDLPKTLEVSTRCGQDSDCNPSNAAGILGCMKGYAALGEHYTGGIATISDEPFHHTNYSFSTLIPACQRVAERVIQRAGGTITEDAYLIPAQRPKPPATLEQWTNQMEILSVGITQTEVNLWDPRWNVVACGYWEDPGYRITFADRSYVLQLTPVSISEPAVMKARLEIPKGTGRRIKMDVSSFADASWQLKVFVNDKLSLDRQIKTNGKFATQWVDVADHAGQTIDVRVEAHAGEEPWHWERAYFARIEIE